MLQGGVCVGLISLFLAVGGVEVAFTEETAWGICFGNEC
jgi:hypothetical protein